jgi:hypothetical protein
MFRVPTETIIKCVLPALSHQSRVRLVATCRLYTRGSVGQSVVDSLASMIRPFTEAVTAASCPSCHGQVARSTNATERKKSLFSLVMLEHLGTDTGQNWTRCCCHLSRGFTSYTLRTESYSHVLSCVDEPIACAALFREYMRNMLSNIKFIIVLAGSRRNGALAVTLQRSTGSVEAFDRLLTLTEANCDTYKTELMSSMPAFDRFVRAHGSTLLRGNLFDTLW